MTQAQAIAIRQARFARVRTIRKGVILGAVALFAATWLLITVVLVSGHDPALARSHASSASGSGSIATSSGSGSSGSNTQSGGGVSSSTGGFSGSAPSALTSGQS